MMAFMRTVFTVFAIINAACLSTGIHARKGDNRLFGAAKNTKEPTGKPTRRPTPIPSRRPTPIPSRRPTPIPSRRPTPIPSLRPTSMTPTVSAGKEEPPTMSPITSPPTNDPTIRLSIPPADSFYIVNPHTSKLVSIRGGACTERNRVNLWEHSHADWQQFILNTDSNLESIECPGMVLNIAGSRCKNGRPIIISKKTSSDSQRWSLREDGVIESIKCPNRGIDIRRYETQNGAAVHLWSLHLKWNQIWITKSASPTALPTASSSQGPTTSPSSSPSVSPSSIPSGSPSNSSSISPSSSPSISPTMSPASSPTASPSLSPSANPSISPTTNPSTTPSTSPSLGPSLTLSSSPTTAPSTSPSNSPSFSPSASPSVAPSNSPTSSPSLGPSLAPNASPTMPPSATPSGSPSESPSSRPSVTPSSSPSPGPSFAPNASPTTSPSASPIVSPSFSPSSSPSVVPSEQPSRRPHSTHPTSNEPTLSPIPDPSCLCDDSHEPIRNLLASEVSTVQGAPVQIQLRASIADREMEVKDTEYVVEESALESLLFKPPSVIFEADSAHRFTSDVVSLGSTTRIEYLEAQASTWGAHSSIRNFFGFTENDDVFNCSSVSAEELESYVNTCKSLPRKNHRIQEFFTGYYGKSEGNVTRSTNEGWVCAQRRLGRALGWLHALYHNSQDIPDFLTIVDDDTYIDQQAVLSYLQREAGNGKGSLARAGCVFERNGDTIPFALPYGGFGLFLNGDAVVQLSTSIYCDGANRDNEVCATLRLNSIGEFDVFTEGMTLFELFARFSSTVNFCMHSDWLSGYIVEFYLRRIGRNDPAANLVGIRDYPMCGNRTAFSGHIRHCTKDSDTCHNQSPHDMEFFSLSSYSKSPESYRSPPILAETNLSAALSSIKNIVEEKDVLHLPNVLMIGAPETASFELADWLLSNGACNAEVFDDEPLYFMKEVHFFDKRFDEGVEFYATRYKHCAQEESTDIMLDATADYLYHPTRVFDLYSQAEQSLLDLKMIVMLRDPVAREAALYNRKVQEYLKQYENHGWFSDVAHPNGTILSFDDYAENVLTKRNDLGEYVNHLKVWASLFGRRNILFLSQEEAETDPEALQWRVTEFLGLRHVHINLNVKKSDTNTNFASTRANQILQLLFTNSNKELQNFLQNYPGPWMEQKPFPFSQFERSKRFAFATVLGWSPNSSQNKLYIDAVRVWIHSIRKSGTNSDMVVIMTYHDSQAESLLKADGATVKLVKRIEYSQNIDEFEPWFADITFAKLRAFELTEYDRVQFFDADVAIEDGSSLDNLFSSFPNTKLVAEGLGPDSPLRAGWMMIKPSQSNFNAMEKILQLGTFDKIRGWNQLDLPVEYPGWRSFSDWNFYGSSLEQGLLFHFFHSLPMSKNPAPRNPDLLLVGDEELHKLGLYHFYGNRKPWSKVGTRVSGNMKSVQEQWLKMHKSLNAHNAQDHVHMNEHVVPLTQVGAELYSQARVLYGYYDYTTAPTAAPKCVCDTKAFEEPL